MGIPPADGLCQKPFTSEVITRIGAYWSPILKRYGNSLVPGTTFPPKAIKDFVWGMVDLSGREIVLLDSPPVQRLRRIRQLGLCFLTFPTATHSRFEHTIGVAYQAERMLRAIAARSQAQAEVLFRALPTIRLAALLHDVGHLPLSHVTERFYTEEECTDQDLLASTAFFRDEVKRHFKSPKVSLSECLSAAFILLPEFYDVIIRAGYSDQEIQHAIALIVGVPPSAELAFARQVISDVLDADKLDYMFRDAKMTGVPLSVDLEILLYKLKCYQTSLQEAPPSMRSFFGENGIANVIGTSVSGFGHAKDVILARSLLHERVYHHHKVLAAERIALALMAKTRPHPADFLAEDDRFFSSNLSPKLSRSARYFALLLENRRLPKRIFTVSYGFLVARGTADVPILSDSEQAAFESLKSLLMDLDKRVLLERSIKEIAGNLSIKMYGTRLGKLRLWIDYPPLLEPLTIDLQVRTPDGTILEGGIFQQQAAAFPLYTSSVSYVYFSGVSEKYVPLLFVSIERKLYELCGIYFGADAAHYAKLNWLEIEATKRHLEESIPDWFVGHRKLRPRSLSAASVVNQARLKELAQRFQEYSVQGGRIDTEQIRRFLDQFPERLVDPMIDVLEKFTFLDRNRLGIEFARKLRADDLTTSSLVPLSKGPQKSAAILPYMLSDSKTANLNFETLDLALQGQKEITFYEESICSGRQPRATVQTWFGLPPELNEPGLGSELSEQLKSALRGKKLHFRFVFGTKWGIENLKALLQQLSMHADVDAAIIHDQQRSVIYDFLDAPTAELLEQFLRKVGLSVLRSTKQKEDPTKWTDSLCEQRCFGYRNHGLLVASSFNCPTSTITALWKTGEFEDVVWLPLFPRRHEVAEPNAA
jgi:HD superfamily phosphohydrolase